MKLINVVNPDEDVSYVFLVSETNISGLYRVETDYAGLPESMAGAIIFFDNAEEPSFVDVSLQYDRDSHMLLMR